MNKKDFSKFGDVISMNKDFHGLFIGALTETNIV